MVSILGWCVGIVGDDAWMAAVDLRVGFLGVCTCVCTLSGGFPRVDCCYTNTDLCNITDAGMKDFSAAVRSSSTITTVALGGKYDWVVSWNQWKRVHVRVCLMQ